MPSYNTNEVAALCMVHPQTIRVWEGLGLIPQAERLGAARTVIKEGTVCRRRWTEEQAETIRRFSDKRYNTKR